jgi:uncharacterized protein
MNRLIQWAILAAMVIFSYSFSWADDASRIISVSGESEIKVMPDQVVIVMGVEKIDKDMTVSKNQNDDMVKAIIDVANRNGVGKTDVATEYFSVEPKYYRDDQKDTFLGYNVRRRVSITLKDVSKYEGLIGDLLAAGVVSIQSVQFQITELRKYRDQARGNAIKAAKEKAIAMASELGLKIGAAQKISEGGSRYYSWYGGWYDYGYGRGMSQNSFQEINSGGADLPMALDKISVSASVSVSFELQ